MTKLQKRVAAFTKENRMETDIAHRLLDAVSELGELAKEVLKGSSYGATAFLRTENWEEEFGDVMFSLLCVANLTGVDAEKAVDAVLVKYKKRIAASGNSGSGGQRKKRP